MKCLLCNNNLEPYYVYDFITYKCYNCNQYYINSKHIDFFIQTFINNTINTKMNNKTLWCGTQSEYDSISGKDSNTLYFIKEV